MRRQAAPRFPRLLYQVCENKFLAALQLPAQAMLRSHTPPHCPAPSPVRPAPHCPRTPCSSHCGGGCGCPCLSEEWCTRPWTGGADRATTAAGAHLRPWRRPCRSPPPRLRCLRGYAARRNTVLQPLGSPLTRKGAPQPSAASRNEAAIAVAERRKRAAYRELLLPGRQRLCVLACEAGGAGAPSPSASSPNL